MINLLHSLLVGLSSSSVSDNDIDSALLDQRDSVFKPGHMLSATVLSWFCFGKTDWLQLFTDSLDTQQTNTSRQSDVSVTNNFNTFSASEVKTLWRYIIITIIINEYL